jgi:hypothetical protein
MLLGAELLNAPSMVQGWCYNFLGMCSMLYKEDMPMLTKFREQFALLWAMILANV